MILALILMAAPPRADVVVYGATSSGVVAAIQTARMGKSVVLIEPGTHIGGLTTGGLSWTDIGNKQVIGGIAREFYRRVKAVYDDPKAWPWETRDHYFAARRAPGAANEDAMWTFEPKVASRVYSEMLAEARVRVVTRAKLDLRPGKGVRKRGGRIEAIVLEDGRAYEGRMFIDATYEGDLMAKAGVKYTVGRESNATHSEEYNGVQAEHRHAHQFPDGANVSPYVRPGDPSSGLLPIIDPAGPGVRGEGDKRIQAYCFRMCLTNVAANRLPIAKPAGYDERDHELLLRFAESGKYHVPSSKYDPIPNGKTDTNNHGAVSTDYMGANYDYPEGDYATRDRIVRRHAVYQKGYMWTLQNHPRVPRELRAYYQQWGLPRDEFATNGHWPTQLYIREARRMVSPVVMTEHHVVGRKMAEDSVGMGAYGMDSHNVQRYVTREGWVRNEGNVQVGGFAPYPVSYRSIVPDKREAENLAVPVCLSASHIAYGSIRMEPVFMVMGQSAATAAVLALNDGVALQDLAYGKLRAKLLEDKQVLAAPEGTRRTMRRVDPGRLEGTVIDDSKAVAVGPWSPSRATQPFLGDSYAHDQAAGDGKASMTFHVAMEVDGPYRVRLLFPPLSNRASNTPVETAGGGKLYRAAVNQRSDPVWLGPYDLPSKFTVTVSNAGTDGHVVVDGLQVAVAMSPEASAATRVFEAWMDGQMAYRGLPGVAVGVVQGKRMVWTRGFGPVTSTTRFRMASHTKLFTATAIMQLRDAGKLKLDDPVSKHLPWFKVAKPAAEDDPPITIEHLITHSSGLPREAASPYWSTLDFPTYDDVRRMASEQPAALSPDVRWKYSNLAFSLAGMVVEAASGEPWAAYVERHIFQPLGMAQSSIDKPVEGLTTGYGRRMPDGSRATMPFQDTRGIGPAAGLTSTVEDMAKFISAQFHKGRGGPILSGATLREMHRVRVMENDWSRGSGLGFSVSRIRNKVYVGHGGSLAGYKTQTYIDLENEVGVVVLTNGDDSRPAQIAERLMQTVGEAVAKSKPSPPKPAWDPAWSRFAGLYRSMWGDVEVVELDGRLAMIDPTSDDPGEQQQLIPLGGGTFRLEAKSGGSAVGEVVSFVERGGRVMRIVTGNTFSDRVER
jgi:CubicO group peptidase (beta-lactamase class C family)